MRSIVSSLLLAFVGTVAFAACGDDGNPIPDIPDAKRVDAAIDAQIDAAASCFLPNGTPANCFDQSACEPTQDSDFLNGCTDGSCAGFDNVARLPRYNNGDLPPLP